MVFQRSEQTGTRTHLEFHSQIWFLPVNTDVNLLSEKLKETMEMRSCANKYSIIIINSKQTYRGSLKEHIVGMEENARREGCYKSVHICGAGI